MSTPQNTGPLVYVLVPLAAILGTAIALQGWHGSRATALLNTPPRSISFAPPPRALSVADDLQIIQDRPLFSATRKFYAPLLAPPPTTPSQLSSYQLMGTLLLPRRPPVAFLRKGAGGATMTISPGDHLDGWTVEAVDAGSTIFGYGDQRVTLKTVSPFGGSAAAQGAGIVRMPIARPAQHPAAAAQPSQEAIRRNPHRPHPPRGGGRRWQPHILQHGIGLRN